MISTNLPPWDFMGALPPMEPGATGTEPEKRAPYKIDLVSFVNYFAYSPKRKILCRNLLYFRSELYMAGIKSGFQWVNGSFLENIELLEDRTPNDIDVVTFFDIPPGMSERSLTEKNKLLFDLDTLKANYSIDNYYHALGKPLDNYHARKVSYWYATWAHRRNRYWKGFVEIGLDPIQDIDAQAALDNNMGDLP